jgi:transcriptional regulator with XRE-family HTH domain
MQKALSKGEFKTPARAPQQRNRKVNDREKEISVIVGQNLKTLRAMVGMSQMTLADYLGVTFQQVQKYESGANRVSAPKLVMMSEIFNTPVTTFFSNTGITAKEESVLPTFGKHGIRAARLIETMRPGMRGAAIRVLQTLADDSDV